MPSHSPAAAVVTTKWKRSVERALVSWYRRHHRDLPWRRTRDPYAVWVSEIMLQQTQVVTVIGYFARFMQAFPNVGALAEADQASVLRLWEGLGYYRRAVQMHRAARIVVDRHGGEFPSALDDVLRLPGIGRYTAGAIVSIAFDVAAPILEANTVRLFSRLVGFAGDPGSAAGRELLWRVAESILPPQDCRTFNQALMELGSLVCTPREPACDGCPLGTRCRARALGAQDRMPARRARPPSEAVREAAVVIWRKGRVLLRRHATGERWAGLWDFLRFPITASNKQSLANELIGSVERRSGLIVETPRRLTTIKHGVTRFRITLDCFMAECTTPRARLARGTWRWVRPEDLSEFPLSMTGRKISRLLMAEQAK
jgi:A/G-specific adenine glycosylase